MSSISIIGSGNMAGAIGGLAVKGGNAVEVISRDAAKAAALADELGNGATAGTWGAAPTGDIVILAVLFDSVVPIVKQYGGALAAQMIAEAAPKNAHVIKAFNTLFRDVLAAGGPLDVFMAGDDPQAKANMSTFIESLGLRPLDVGQLPMARVLENAGLLQMGLVSHAVKHTNFALGINIFS
jgi:predicted dinucleotide-binding enzyme